MGANADADGVGYTISWEFIEPDYTKVPVTLSTDIVTATLQMNITQGTKAFVASPYLAKSNLQLIVQQYDEATGTLTMTFSGTLIEPTSGASKTVRLGIVKAKFESTTEAAE